MELTLFRSLPDELIETIWSLLDPPAKVALNRENFYRYHDLVYSSMTSHDKFSYHRVMVRNDDSFIFDRILKGFGREWLSIKKYIYDNRIHNNYLYFLLCLTQEHRASKCSEVLNKYFENEGVCKNVYKKYRIKNIRWSN